MGQLLGAGRSWWVRGSEVGLGSWGVRNEEPGWEGSENRRMSQKFIFRWGYQRGVSGQLRRR